MYLVSANEVRDGSDDGEPLDEAISQAQLDRCKLWEGWNYVAQSMLMVFFRGRCRIAGRLWGRQTATKDVVLRQHHDKRGIDSNKEWLKWGFNECMEACVRNGWPPK